jgi:exosome complex component RRP4
MSAGLGSFNNRLTGCLAQVIDSATRIAISRVANIIRVLAAHFVPLTDALLLESYEWAIEQEGDPKELLQDDVGEALVHAITRG